MWCQVLCLECFHCWLSLASPILELSKKAFGIKARLQKLRNGDREEQGEVFLAFAKNKKVGKSDKTKTVLTVSF